MVAGLKGYIAAPAAVPTLLALGALERVAWIVARGGPTHATGEAADVAIMLARTGRYADALAPGSGPSAHILPIPPAIAAQVYHLLGVRSFTAEAVLAGWSIGLSMLAFLLLYLAFGLLGASRNSRLSALAIACLVPLNIQLEASFFRVWEGALANVAAFSFLLLIIELDRKESIGWTDIATAAFAAALTFFIAPHLGIACYACAGIWTLARIPPARWPVTILAAAGALALFLVPWTIRNQQALGEPIWLRSNFGLELTLGMNPAAVSTRDPHGTFLARLDQIHPNASAGALARMKAAGGEAPYARSLGARTKAWMIANPGATAVLAGQHLIQMVFPPLWFWTSTGNVGIATMPKLFITWAASALALTWVISVPWRRRRDLIYPALMLVLPILPYMITQPILRYRYAFFALSLFMACDFAARFIARRAPSDAPAPMIDDQLAVAPGAGSAR